VAQRLRAVRSGGNPIGCSLRCLSAVIASPCTGPAIAGLIVLVAQLANPVLGFIMFVCLGLGMGTVFFAAGSLNMLAKPGPWMVWVRYAFGVLLVGAALYYLRSAGKIGPATLLAMGAGLAVAGAIGIAHHLVTKEGEEAPVARRRGAVVGGLTVAITAIVAVLTGGFAAKAEAVAAGPTVAASGGADTDDTWLKVKSREALYAAVQDAIRDGRPTVVDFWAEWCHYCNVYDKIIDRTPEILAGMRRRRVAGLRTLTCRGSRRPLGRGRAITCSRSRCSSTGPARSTATSTCRASRQNTSAA
jgi:thiol:disulfide interchange protein DsbD